MQGRTIVLLALAGLCACQSPTEELQYDERTNQGPVGSYEQIDSVLATLEMVTYSELDPEYIQYSELDGKYHSYFKEASFYLVQGDDIHKYLVGTKRIRDFLPKDKYAKLHKKRPKAGVKQVLRIRKEALYKLLDLMDILRERGYRHEAFTVYHGFRYPKYNRDIGGAEGSRHLLGEAIDIRIKDINVDGLVTWDDKQIVLDILEEEVIRDQGGIGRYPHSMGVHFDIRGYRARWDSY